MKGLLTIFAGGLLFGFGLALSGLAKQEIVLSFVQLRDLGLAVTMIGALAITLPIYQLAPRLRPRPAHGRSFERFPVRVTGANVVGGALFGVGWGISGVCPGAAIASLGTGNWPILLALAGMLVGAYVQGAWLARPPAAAAGAAA
ncbi:MAG: YeeE/YedE family protein [Planctomycetota bacterium]|jgi:uncharacterized membrane protein YedE/YeeE